jgi:hypothetical protein
MIGFIDTFFTITRNYSHLLNSDLVWSLSILPWSKTDSVLVWSTTDFWFMTGFILSLSLSLSLLLRPTVSRPVCLGIKHPFGAYDQILITVRQLRSCWCGFSLTRGRVCRLQLLLALASAVILGSESLGTRDYILLSQIRDFPFHRLLRLTGLRWRYSTPRPHGLLSVSVRYFPWSRLFAYWASFWSERPLI